MRAISEIMFCRILMVILDHTIVYYILIYHTIYHVRILKVMWSFRVC